ncbi:MAG: outer membrane beta-barrel protein [Bacteroidales bacterium]|jgi:hypothetical protein|nr:outer membrane beta-barrel protein [Bacteroidales bacterium]
MDEREANIDVVFRNGLKDYEVLPPADVWKNIYPAVRKRQRPFTILRAAAIIAVVISLSFLAYRWGAEISTGLVNNDFFVNPESEAPEADNQDQLMIADAGNTFTLNSGSGIALPADQPENFVVVEKEADSPQSIDYQSATSDLPINVKLADRHSYLSAFVSTGSSINKVSDTPEYLPEIQAEKKTERWSIAALVSPTYNMNIKSGNNEFANQLLTEDQTMLSYSGGVALSYKINKRISVQSGIYYSTFGHELSGITAFSGFRDYNQAKGDRTFEVLTTSGTVYTNNSDIFLSDGLLKNRIITSYTGDVSDIVEADLQYLGNSLHQNFGYLELPLILRYKVIDRIIDFNIIGGLSSNLLVTNAVFASSDKGKYEIGQTDDLNPLTFSSSIGMGLEYSLSKNFSLNMEPTFRYYLNSSGGIPGMKLHPYTFGIFSGLSYKF